MGKKVIVKIKSLLESRDMTLRGLSRDGDVRHSALSELANGKRQNINFRHIASIAEACGIEDIREIIDLEDTKD